VRLRYILLGMVLLGVFVLPVGCGKKAPPSLSKAKEQFSQMRGVVGTTSQLQKEQGAGSGMLIYSVRSDLENDAPFPL